MTEHHERRIARAEKWYRRLLCVLPSTFRAEHGHDMVETFRDQSRHEFELGGVGRARVYWLRAYLRLFSCGARERLAGLPVGASRSRRAGPFGIALRFLEQLTQDARFALRGLRKRPLFTAVAVGALGLGVGAATTVYTVVDAVLVRRLPYDEPGRLVNVWVTNPEWRSHEILHQWWNSIALSYPEYRDWREGTRLFEDVAIYGDEYATLTGFRETERVHVGMTTASLFEVLGVRPSLGRAFLPGEDGPTAERLAILSDEVWRVKFGAQRDVIGTAVTLDDEQYTVVGVLPPQFRLRSIGFAGGADDGERAVWIPIGQPGTRIDRGNRSFEAIGRLAPSVSLAAAQSEAGVLLAGETDPTGQGARLVPRKEAEVGGLRSPLLLLFGAAGMLLLIACGNVATLLMGEVGRRGREMATRGALGAGRARIARQLLTESVLLGLLGSAIGGALALVSVDLLVALAPPLPAVEHIAVNARVLLFACGAGLFTSLLFGLAPALRPAPGLSGMAPTGREQSPTGTDRVFQDGVLLLQIALTAVLLVGAGLLMRSLVTLLSVDAGFDAANVASIRVSLPEHRYASSAEIAGFYDGVLERIESIPDVRIAGGTEELPLAGELRLHTFQIEGRETGADERPPAARRSVVLPGFHETMRIPLLAGRSFSRADAAGVQSVMIISELMARRFWPDRSALGATVLYDTIRTIVGVVGDVQQTALDTDVEPTFYVPHGQLPSAEMNLVARTDASPQQVIELMRAAVLEADAAVPITRASTAQSFVTNAAGSYRYRTLLMLAFAIVSAALATAGVFGVTARAVTQQSREMGIRLALGAGEGRIVLATVRRSLATGLLGTGLGLLGALWAARLLSRFLFGVQSTDLSTYTVVAAALVVLSLLGSYVPARRVTQLDPADVLRAE
jgi:putative ABC transport system permease protein